MQINVIDDINKLKNEKHMIISIEEEKASATYSMLSWQKINTYATCKLSIEGAYLNTINSIYEKFTAALHRMGEHERHSQ